MKRLVSCLLLLLVLQLAFAGGTKDAAQAGKAEKMELKWSGMMTPTHAWPITAQDICKEVAERTNGRITIEFYPAGALGTQQEGIEMLWTGDLAFLTSGPSIFASYVPQAQIFTFPYIFKDREHVRRVIASPVIQKMFTELFDKYTSQVDRLIDQLTDENLKEMVGKGLVVVEPDREAFRKHAVDHIMKVYGEDPKWKDVLTRMLSIK